MGLPVCAFLQAEAAKEEADRAFKAISDTAKREVSELQTSTWPNQRKFSVHMLS